MHFNRLFLQDILNRQSASNRVEHDADFDSETDNDECYDDDDVYEKEPSTEAHSEREGTDQTLKLDGNASQQMRLLQMMMELRQALERQCHLQSKIYGITDTGPPQPRTRLVSGRIQKEERKFVSQEYHPTDEPVKSDPNLNREISGPDRQDEAMVTDAVKLLSKKTPLITDSENKNQTIVKLQSPVDSATDMKSFRRNERLSKKKGRVRVEVRVVFLKVGEIDTLKEYYHADAFIQAKWHEPRLDGKTDQEIKKINLHRCWNPLILIDNILSESKDHYWITTQRNEKDEIFVIERRRLRGTFQETLELNDFPLDVQDLTITLTSERPDSELKLVADKNERCGINLQTLIDQQEWKLHEHIEVKRRSATQAYTNSAQSHPCISVTCRAARRPGYFYWNVFLIMFFITGLSFATFSVPPERPENRLQLSFTLFLTSVAFKFVINQSLPKISYLTYMDKYVLMSLAILCVVSIWHAVAALITTEADLLDIAPMPKMASTETATEALHRLLINDTASSGDRISALKDKGLPVTKNCSSLTDRSCVNETNKVTKLVNVTNEHINRSDWISTSSSDTADDKSLPNVEQLLVMIGEVQFKQQYHKRQLMLRIERDVFVSFALLFVLAHLTFAFWLYFDRSLKTPQVMS